MITAANSVRFKPATQFSTMVIGDEAESGGSMWVADVGVVLPAPIGDASQP